MLFRSFVTRNDIKFLGFLSRFQMATYIYPPFRFLPFYMQQQRRSQCPARQPPRTRHLRTQRPGQVDAAGRVPRGQHRRRGVHRERGDAGASQRDGRLCVRVVSALAPQLRGRRNATEGARVEGGVRGAMRPRAALPLPGHFVWLDDGRWWMAVYAALGGRDVAGAAGATGRWGVRVRAARQVLEW